MFKKSYVFIFIVICLFLVGACGIWLTKDQIIRLTIDNIELLNEAVVEIYNLDESVRFIANTRFRQPNPNAEIDFEGIYTSGSVDGELVVKPLDSPVFYELLRDGRIRSISIIRIDGEISRIVFYTRSRGVRYLYEGFYFSSNNKPQHVFGRADYIWENPIPYNDGWFRLGEISYYYTERIVENWFYFEMVYHMGSSSNRVPEDLPLE